MRKKSSSFFLSHSFIILDVTSKTFTLIYTVLTNYYLTKLLFSDVSYFRTTLTMVVGIITTALGYYILNFYSDCKCQDKKFKEFWGLLITIPILGLFFFIISLYFSIEFLGFHISSDFSLLLLFSIISLALLSQLLVYLLKVTGVDTWCIMAFVITSILSLVVLFICLVFEIEHSQYYVLMLYYASAVVISLYGIYGSSDFPLIKEAVCNLRNPFNCDFRKFYLPNLLESVVSVPIAWLSITIYVAYVGIFNVGELLLIQMILGLFVFLCGSLTLNYFSNIHTDTQELRTNSFMSLANKSLLLSCILVLFSVLFWRELRDYLHVIHISDESIFLLSVATILQANLIPLGAVFKRSNLSRFTLLHNAVYAVLFIALESLLTQMGVNDGFAISFLVAWCFIFLMMIYQSNALKLVIVREFIIKLASLVVIYVLLFRFVVD